MNRYVGACVLLCLVACATSPARPAQPTPQTRYRTGMFVTYRYEGSYRATPITLHEEVVEQQGNKLTIEVHVDAGDEQRTFRMHMTDTPENQRNNVVDALEVRDGETWRALPNQQNADLMRMFEGTFVMPDGPAQEVVTTNEKCMAAGREFDCSVTRSVQTVDGKLCQVLDANAAGFIWSHVSAEYRTKDSGEVLYLVQVVAFGP